MQKNFTVYNADTSTALSQSLKYIHDNLAALKLNTRDSYHAELMCEESLVRLLEHADFTETQSFTVNVRKFFGDVMIDLAVPGEEFDFAESIELYSGADKEIPPDAEAAVQNIMLRSFAENLSYKHSRHFNKITVKASRSNYSTLYKTLTALVLAVIAGIAAKSCLPESIYMSVNDNILAAVRTIFMNGLKMCAVPVVFFSIAVSVSDVGSFSGLRRSGMRLFRWFLVMQASAVMAGFGLVRLFGIGKGAGLHAVSASSGNTAGLSAADTLINLMPENIVRPFLEGNMLQLILVAFLAGAAASSTGAKIVIQFFTEVYKLFMRITSCFMKFMPLVIFCSIASMIITTGLNTVLSVAGLLVTLWAGYLLMNMFYCIVLKVCTGLNPAVVYRKSMPVLMTGLSTCSSNACLPDMMKSAQALGISPKLYSFSLPLGVSINKITNCLYFSANILAAAHMYGISISWTGLLSLGGSVIIVNMGTPGLAGATVISLSVLFSQGGLPMEFIAAVMSIETLHDMINTPTICAGNLVCTLLTAEKEKLLDVQAYNQQQPT